MSHDLQERIRALLAEVAKDPEAVAFLMRAIAEQVQAVPRGPTREWLLENARREGDARLASIRNLQVPK